MRFTSHRTLMLISLALMTFFFLEATKQFIATLYYESLVKMTTSPGALGMFLFCAPFALLFFRRVEISLVMAISGAVLIVHHLYGGLDSEPSLYLIFHGVAVTAYGLFLPSFLYGYYQLVQKTKHPQLLYETSMSLALALLLDFVFQFLGDGFNVTSYGWINSQGNVVIPALVFSLPLALLNLYALTVSYRVLKTEFPEGLWIAHDRGVVKKSPLFFPGICMGIAFANLIFLMGSPLSLVHWTPGDYRKCLLMTALILAAFIWALSHIPRIKSPKLHRHAPFYLHLIGIALQFLVLFDVLFIDSGWAPYFLGLALVGLIANFALFFHISARQPSVTTLVGVSFVAGVVFVGVAFLQVLCEFHIFISPKLSFFRGLWKPLFFGATCVYLWGAFWYALRSYFRWIQEGKDHTASLPRIVLFSRSALPCLVLLTLYAVLIKPPVPLDEVSSFNVVSFNVHQGFDNHGKMDPRIFLKTLGPLQPDILGLQESDTTRIFSGKTDLVYWLSRKMGMFYYFGPPTDEMSVGTSLLSRFPLRDTRTHLFEGKYLHRAFVEAVVNINHTPVKIGTYQLELYLSDRCAQMQWIFENHIQNASMPLILLGDLNTLEKENFALQLPPPPRKDGWDENRVREFYRYRNDPQVLEQAKESGFTGIATWKEYLVDTWRFKHPREESYSWEDRGVELGVIHEHLDAAMRIDYIFVSPQFEVVEADIIHSKEAAAASDHYPVFAKLKLALPL